MLNIPLSYFLKTLKENPGPPKPCWAPPNGNAPPPPPPPCEKKSSSPPPPPLPKSNPLPINILLICFHKILTSHASSPKEHLEDLSWVNSFYNKNMLILYIYMLFWYPHQHLQSLLHYHQRPCQNRNVVFWFYHSELNKLPRFP